MLDYFTGRYGCQLFNAYVYANCGFRLNPPDKPSKPSGPTTIEVDEWATYTSSTTDPDEDQIYMKFDWGDGSNSGWLGPQNSGSLFSKDNRWSQKGDYDIRCIAKDIHGAQSTWSLPLSIAVPRTVGCPEGTQITMTSGIGPITKSIEDIEVGEFILSYNPILQVTTAAEVIEICIYTEGLPDYNLIFNDNLEVIPSHTLYINGIGWMEAENAQIGYYMLGNIPDTPDIYPVIISSKEPTELVGPIYDLVIQPLAGEAIGYWADGILVGGYD